MCDVDIGRRMVFGFEERREQMREKAERVKKDREHSGVERDS